MRWIKESTAGTYPIGPFMDGSGAILGSLNIIMSDIFLSKQGGVFGTISGTPTAYADRGGYYKMVLDTTDTDTRGILRAYANKATALPLWEDFMVVPTLNYDSLFGADRFQVDLRELGDPTLDFTTVVAIKAKTDNLPSGIPKNVALSGFMFLMILALDHVTPATGKTITAQISKDGGAFASCTNTVTEITNGFYKINLTQTEMNATVIALKFSETDCDQRSITIITSS